MVDTEELAQELYDASLPAREVPLRNLWPMLLHADPGHPAVDEPDKYRWFVIERFPTEKLQVTLEGMMKEAGSYAAAEKWRHDRIKEMLEAGNVVWPAFVTADGVILDGYHRIAAHRTLGHKMMPVVVAVPAPGTTFSSWDALWNDAFA